MDNKTVTVELPDSSQAIDDPDYISWLVTETGLPWRRLEVLTGVNRGSLKKMASADHYLRCPYAVQYILEILAKHAQLQQA